MSENDTPSKKEQEAIEAARKGLRQAGEDAAEYIPNPKTKKAIPSLLRDLLKDPYEGIPPTDENDSS